MHYHHDGGDGDDDVAVAIWEGSLINFISFLLVFCLSHSLSLFKRTQPLSVTAKTSKQIKKILNFTDCSISGT